MSDDGDRRRIGVVDAFTEQPLTGNPAGVVPDADDLTDEQMQAVARELSVPETVFLLSSSGADRRVRYFTPTNEVDLCGHATVASHVFLFEEGIVNAGTHTLETNVGVLDIDVEEDGRVWMTQDDPEVREIEVDYERIADALGVDVASLRDVGADLPTARATTGLPFLVVPVNFLEHLGNATPDMAAIEDISEEYDVAGVYPFTFDTLEGDSTLHARLFAPREGIPEDPVTGTASGAVAAYLRRFAALDDLDDLRFEQGDFLDRAGRVFVRASEEIRVGGHAVTALDGDLAVPDLDGDEILEA